MAGKHTWLGTLLPLALVPSAWAAEPAPDAGAKVELEQPDPPGFDLRSESVRELVRTTASTQMGMGYRIESSYPPRPQRELTEALRRQDPPVVKKKATAPRLPPRPPPCDGFWSCGLEALLGLNDFDDAVYNRVRRDQLMHQGSFTDSSRIHQSVSLPILSPAQMGDTGPLRPR